MHACQTKPTAQERILSIDALRGFDMFWIMGPEVGHWLASSLVILIFGYMPKGVAWQLEHHWGVFTAWDIIMPLFLFIVGAAMPFSLGRRLDAGDGRRRIYLRALRRVAWLWILGMICQGNLLHFRFAELKFYSNTLQAIAAGYLIATVALVELRRIRGQVALFAALLTGYGLIMLLVPPPGGMAGDFSPAGNLANWIDHAIMGSHHDGKPYAWILPSMGFGATVLLGVFAGHLLQSPLSGPRKFCILLGAGVSALALGWASSFIVPNIKHLWTSSMVLWAGGWSLLLLAFFYGIIDVLGYKRWAFFFQVIGSNAILAYMIQPLFRFGDITKHLFSGLCSLGGPAESFLLALCTTITLWGLLYYLYRQRIFVKV
ncbi:MAG: DUF5009 domain-containing protein [Verrucomicrobiota bacterium]